MADQSLPPLELSTREGYDLWAAIYDDEENPLIAVEEPVVASLLDDVGGRDVLDLGAGTGRHTLRLAAAGANVTAVDFSTGMLDRARGKPGAEHVRFVEHDVHEPLPLGPASFDVVLSALVLDHVADLDGFLREAARVCRAAGRIVLSTVHPAMLLRGVRARFSDPQTARETRPESFDYTISDFVMAIGRAGLKIEHMSEHAVGAELAARSARAARYLGWPIALIFALRP